MIESEMKFPTPEMLERIAAALEIDGPELFTTKFYPMLENSALSNFHDIVINDISQVISNRLREMKESINAEMESVSPGCPQIRPWTG